MTDLLGIDGARAIGTRDKFQRLQPTMSSGSKRGKKDGRGKMERISRRASPKVQQRRSDRRATAAIMRAIVAAGGVVATTCIIMMITGGTFDGGGLFATPTPTYG